MEGRPADTQGTPIGRLAVPNRHSAKSFPGKADTIVPVEESMILHEALGKAGAKTSLRIIEAGPHGWLWQQTSDDVISFFTKNLR